MPVVFDASGGQTGNQVTSGGTVSWSHTRGNVGANHWLIVIVSVSVNTSVAYSSASVTKTATYGSQSMTYLGGENVPGSSVGGWVLVFGLQNPNPGTNTVTVNVSASGVTNYQLMGTSVGYFNVASISSVDSTTGSGFSSQVITAAQLPSSAVGVFAIASANSHVFTSAPAITEPRYAFGSSVTGNADYIVISDIIGTGSDVTVTSNSLTNTGNFAAVYLALNATTDNFKPDELTIFSTAGSFTYTIPEWATRIDMVLLGGGEAGTNGTFVGNGSGGLAGSWGGVGLVRGDNIPWTTTEITGTVGAGGSSNGAPGSASTYTITGVGSGSVDGGSGNRGVTQPVGEGTSPVVFNGMICAGGGEQSNLNNNGRTPGGGGAGGGFSSGGGSGAPGRVWIYARKYGDASDFFTYF